MVLVWRSKDYRLIPGLIDFMSGWTWKVYLSQSDRGNDLINRTQQVSDTTKMSKEFKVCHTKKPKRILVVFLLRFSSNKIHHFFFIVNTDWNCCLLHFNGVSINGFDMCYCDDIRFVHSYKLFGW